MKIISVAEDNIYNLWQIELQVYSMLKNKINNFIVVFCGKTEEPNTYIEYLVNKFLNTPVEFYYYKIPKSILRREKKYNAVIQPFGVYKYLKDHPTNEKLFIIDTDVIFLHPINFESFESNKIYTSPNHYGRYDYYLSRGHEYATAYTLMCHIVGLNKNDLLNFENSTVPSLNPGGHTIIIDNITHEFFKKVLEDSLNIFDNFKNINNKVSDDMCWMSMMWGYYYNLLLLERPFFGSKELDFCWATNDNICNKNILHMAGAYANNKDKVFSKLDFLHDSPINPKYINVLYNYSKNHKASIYVDLIIEYIAYQQNTI